MISIEFLEIAGDKATKTVLQKAAKIALGETAADLSIVVCNDNFIQNLNREYRNVNRPTDVLSFPSEEVDPEDGSRYLGDIIISLPRATAQALEANHPIAEELSMLAIHGVLHLLGYDHQNEAEKKEMWQKQAAYLLTLGITMDKFSGDE
jgi:probable rRNA maturation factor